MAGVGLRTNVMTLALTNYLLPGLLPKRNVRSVSLCSVFCFDDDLCLGVFYNRKTMECYPSTIQVDSTDVSSLGMFASFGTKYYKRYIIPPPSGQSTTTGTPAKSCPTAIGYQSDPSSSTCLRYGKGLTCSMASAACGYDGGRLFKVDSDVKDIAMKNMIEKYNTGGSITVCFGLVNRPKESGPRWEDGSPLSTYTNWARNEPSSPGQGCCTYNRPNPSQELQWNDGSCEVENDYVCEIVIS